MNPGGQRPRRHQDRFPGPVGGDTTPVAVPEGARLGRARSGLTVQATKLVAHVGRGTTSVDRFERVGAEQLVQARRTSPKPCHDACPECSSTGHERPGWPSSWPTSRPTRCRGPRRASPADYATKWLRTRTGLRPRSREMYESLLGIHILPGFEGLSLGSITPDRVRAWHSAMVDGSSPTMAPKAYRLLRSILATAVDDDVLVKNPARIRSAGQEQAIERRVPTLPQLYPLADAVDGRYRAMVLTAGLAGLRWGEVTALTRRRVDLLHATITVAEQRVRLDSGQMMVGPPKSDAGRRTVAIPAPLVAELADHLGRYVVAGADAVVFTSGAGAPLDRTNFRERVWRPACAEVGVQVTFHDLQHLAATLAAVTGATTKEIMARLGHSTQQAALMYQHATADRDAAIPEALTGMVEAAGLATVSNIRPRHRCAMDEG